MNKKKDDGRASREDLFRLRKGIGSVNQKLAAKLVESLEEADTALNLEVVISTYLYGQARVMADMLVVVNGLEQIEKEEDG